MFKKIQCMNCDSAFVIEISEDSDVVVYQAVKSTEEKIESPRDIADKDDAATTTTTTVIKKQRSCKKCGMPGHRSDNCFSLEGPEESDETTALESGGQNEVQTVSVTKALKAVTRPQFEGIIKLKDMDYSSLDASKQSGMYLTVVNRIYQFTDYDKYAETVGIF